MTCTCVMHIYDYVTVTVTRVPTPSAFQPIVDEVTIQYCTVQYFNKRLVKITVKEQSNPCINVLFNPLI
jgi:hypothetical protein